jgi:L-rhamnose mutarotase
MINVSDRSFEENQNRHLMFNNTFPKIVPFMKHCGIKWYSQIGHK